MEDSNNTQKKKKKKRKERRSRINGSRAICLFACFQETLTLFGDRETAVAQVWLNKFRSSFIEWRSQTARQQNKARDASDEEGKPRQRLASPRKAKLRKTYGWRRPERRRKRERERAREGEKNPIVQYPRLELRLFVSLPNAGMPIASVLRAMFPRTTIGRINGTAYHDYRRRHRRRLSSASIDTWQPLEFAKSFCKIYIYIRL